MVAKRMFGGLRVKGYAFDLDILLQMSLRDEAVVSFPVYQRKTGHSNVSLHTTLQMLRDTIWLYFSFLPQEAAYVRSHPWSAFLMMRHVLLLPAALLLYAACLPFSKSTVLHTRAGRAVTRARIVGLGA